MTPDPPPSGQRLHRRRLWSLLAALAVGLLLFWWGWVVLGADSQGEPGDAITTGTVVAVAPDCRATARFEVGGVTYTATNTAANPTAGATAGTTTGGCPYVVGGTHPVSYNPADPADATLLDAGPISGWRWAALLAGCVLVLSAAVGLIRATVLRARDGGAPDGGAPDGPAPDGPAPDGHGGPPPAKGQAQGPG